MKLGQKIKQFNWKSLRIFLITAFIPAWILFALPAILRSAGLENTRLIWVAGWSLAMWMPGLGAILATKREGQKIISKLGLNKLGRMKIYLWAWLVPIIASIASGIVTWLLGWGQLDTSFSIIRQSLESIPDTQNINLSLVVGLQIAASLTFGPLFNTIFAMGEELGWRGYLLPKLMPLGQIPAMLISGVIWGIWHAPAIIQGHNYPDNPILGIGLMIVFTTLLGIFFSWLYLKTKSPWAPALGHGTVNAVAGLPLLFLTGINLTLGGALTSISGWIVLAVLVGILVWKKEIPLADDDNVSRETIEI